LGVLGGEVGVLEEALEVGREETVAIEEVEEEKPETIRRCDVVFVEHADHRVGEMFGFLVVFVEASGTGLAGYDQRYTFVEILDTDTPAPPYSTPPTSNSETDSYTPAPCPNATHTPPSSPGTAAVPPTYP
jgi:hypothetical protein